MRDGINKAARGYDRLRVILPERKKEKKKGMMSMMLLLSRENKEREGERVGLKDGLTVKDGGNRT